MDKIDLQSASLLNPSLISGLKTETKKTRTRNETQKSRKTFFSEIFSQSKGTVEDLGPLVTVSPSEEALTELMDEVHIAGSELLERPFAKEIVRYKKAVRNFIHYVLENGYEIHKSQGIKKKTGLKGEAEWKSTVYNQVRIIDRKLEEMAAAILSGQANQLEKISKIDEIKGLLVDLTISGMIKEKDD